jgi:hypothetical protein
MAVLMTSEVSGQTLAGYSDLFDVVSSELQSAKGFLMHASHPVDGGWRVIEIWDSRDDAAAFFATTIAPHLPEGIRPKLSFTLLHDVVQP